MWRYQNAAHYLAGVLTAVSGEVSTMLPLVGAMLFLAYEVNEDWHLHDQAYQDILEFMLGFFMAVTGLIIWRLIL